MLTIHSGTDGTALVADGGLLAAVGPLDAVRAAHPGARVRDWPGALRPGLTHEGELPPAPTPRERVHALLRRGVTAVATAPADPALRSALDRSGLLLGAPGAAPGAGRPGGLRRLRRARRLPRHRRGHGFLHRRA